jgi:hypothetical protein
MWAELKLQCTKAFFSQQSYYEIAVWMDLENVTLRGKDKEERV